MSERQHPYPAEMQDQPGLTEADPVTDTLPRPLQVLHSWQDLIRTYTEHVHPYPVETRLAVAKEMLEDIIVGQDPVHTVQLLTDWTISLNPGEATYESKGVTVNAHTPEERLAGVLQYIDTQKVRRSNLAFRRFHDGLPKSNLEKWNPTVLNEIGKRMFLLLLLSGQEAKPDYHKIFRGPEELRISAGYAGALAEKIIATEFITDVARKGKKYPYLQQRSLPFITRLASGESPGNILQDNDLPDTKYNREKLTGTLRQFSFSSHVRIADLPMQAFIARHGYAEFQNQLQLYIDILPRVKPKANAVMLKNFLQWEMCMMVARRIIAYPELANGYFNKGSKESIAGKLGISSTAVSAFFKNFELYLLDQIPPEKIFSGEYKSHWHSPVHALPASIARFTALARKLESSPYFIQILPDAAGIIFKYIYFYLEAYDLGFTGEQLIEKLQQGLGYSNARIFRLHHEALLLSDMLRKIHSFPTSISRMNPVAKGLMLLKFADYVRSHVPSSRSLKAKIS